MAEKIEKLELGQQLEVLLQDEDGTILQRGLLEVVRTPGPGDPPNAYAFKTVEEGVAPATGAAAPEPEGAGAFEVLRFAWEFIKDNQPINDIKSASTYVLYKNTDTLDYAHAKEGHSTTGTLTVRDKTFTSKVLVKVEFKLKGAYGAIPNPKKDIPNGHYLPSIFFGVPTIETFFIGISTNARAEVGHPYNVGSHDNVQPRVKVDAKFTVSTFGSSHTWTFGFEADGKDGFRRG